MVILVGCCAALHRNRMLQGYFGRKSAVWKCGKRAWRVATTAERTGIHLVWQSKHTNRRNPHFESPDKEWPRASPLFLQQLGIEGEGWLKLVGSFTDKRGRLRRAIGRPAALQAEAAKRGQKWIQGIALSREIFGAPTAEPPSDPQ